MILKYKVKYKSHSLTWNNVLPFQVFLGGSFIDLQVLWGKTPLKALAPCVWILVFLLFLFYWLFHVFTLTSIFYSQDILGERQLFWSKFPGLGALWQSFSVSHTAPALLNLTFSFLSMPMCLLSINKALEDTSLE